MALAGVSLLTSDEHCDASGSWESVCSSGIGVNMVAEVVWDEDDRERIRREVRFGLLCNIMV